MQRLQLAGLWVLCQIAALLIAGRMAWAILVAPDRAWSMAVAYDRLGNSAVNDNQVQTISERAGKAKAQGRRWGCMLCRFLDLFDKGHCARVLKHPPGG